MIRQSGANPAGIAIDPQPVTTPSDEGQWRGLDVFRLGRVLVRSVNPFYEPPDSRPPAPDIAGSTAGKDAQDPDDQVSHFLQATALATRAVAAYTNLPTEINNLLGYLANLSVVGRFANDQLNNCAGRVPEPGAHRENTPDETAENTKEKTGKTSQKPRPQPKRHSTTTLQIGQMPDTSLALGALVGLCAAGVSSASDPDSWIKVNNTDDLNTICRNGKSCSGKYQLTKDINGSQLAPIGNKTHGFNGHLDGGGHIIHNLSHCLVKHLTGNGSITNLNFIEAKLISTAPTGVAACEMSGDAIIGNILVEDAYIVTKGAHAAIGAGSVSDRGTVINTRAVNCHVKTYLHNSHAGIGAGYLSGGKVTNTRAIDCHVEAEGTEAKAGIGAGMSKGGIVTGTNATNCTVKTAKRRADAGIGVGSQAGGGIVTRTFAHHCNVATLNNNADAGIGAGKSQQSTTSYTKAVNCEVSTTKNGADAGIGAGEMTQGGTISQTTAVNCNVATSGTNAAAGIGAGLTIQGNVSHTTAVNCNLKTNKKGANAGIGIGNNLGSVTDTTAKNCTVKTSGILAHAGIGAGTHNARGIITNTIAVDCDVSTGGESSKAGIGAGYVKKKGTITNTKAIDSKVTSFTRASISGGKKPVICNVLVNHRKRSSDGGCQSWQDNNFCANIDSGLLTPKCQTVNSLDNPANARPTSPIPETVPTIPNTTFSSPAPVITSPPPTTFMPARSTVPNTTFSSPGSTTLATPIPFVASLNATTKAVIAMGTVIVVLLGVIIMISCRYYRSSTNANRNREQPIPGGSQPRTEGQRFTLSRDLYQSLENRKPQPGFPREHYQPLLFNLISLPPVPQSPYQGLVYKQGNMAGSTSMDDSEHEPALHHSPPYNVYQELSEYYTDLDESDAHQQAGAATADSLLVTNTDYEPIPGPISDNPVYQVLTEPETDPDHNHDGPAVLVMSGMVTGNSSPTTKEYDHDQLSEDYV